MASTFFKDLYDEAENGPAASSIPEGVYDVTVTRAQPYAQSKLIFLTLAVANGPAAGKEAEVSLYFPGEGDKRGARIFFHKKIAGFLAFPDVKQAFTLADSAASLEDGLTIVGQALEGKTVTATLGLQASGQYAGSNELRETKAITGTPQVAAAPQAAPEAAAVVITEPAPAGVPF